MEGCCEWSDVTPSFEVQDLLGPTMVHTSINQKLAVEQRMDIPLHKDIYG